MDESHRLPRAVVPHAYRITLEPDIGAATFTGTVEIDLEVVEPVAEVVCNAADLELSAATLSVDGEVRPCAVALDPVGERAVFTPDRALGTGAATLRCEFSGILNDRLQGFYRSTFVDQDGQTRTIATTQMEETDARRAFPCWDEPDRKATFELTLVVPDDLVAVSNAPVRAEEPAGPGRRRVHFAPTMKMSSYLVAAVVGPLEVTEPVDVDGVPVRVVHVPGKGHLAPFALEVAAHALRFFTGYFGIAYPAEKLDLVALPDFAMGAMENLGCVTFRETALLVDPDQAARVELERVADVVAHELAHMWFGDLVTMGWWEGIWLNEAFATFMETLCVDAFRPSWHRWLSFGIERERALNVDGLHQTRPIEYPVRLPAEAAGMFDVLTYEKGASVLRMLEQFLGATTFRDGIRRYLARHAYANTVTTDLWDALEEESGQPVRAVMNSWILQGGHPVVSLDPDGTTVRQAPFTYGPPPAGVESAVGDTWQVPMAVRALGGAGTSRLLLDGEQGALPAAAGDGPAVINAGGWGVYRSDYPPAHLAALGARLGDLEPLERALLFLDTWALVLSGRRQLGEFLALAAGLGAETEPTTWVVTSTALGQCRRVADETERPLLAAVARRLLGGRWAAVGWEAAPGEDERTPTLRASLLRTLGVVGLDPEVRAGAAGRFDAALAGGPPVPADIEAAVLDVVADQLRPGDYDTVLARYRGAATPQEEQRAMFALATFPDADLGRRTFELARTEVRTQNAPYLVGRLLMDQVAGPAAWEALVGAWDEVLARYPASSHHRMLEGAASLFGSDELADSVRAWLAAHPVEVAARSVDQTAERLGVNVAFARRYRGRLGEVLAPFAGG